MTICELVCLLRSSIRSSQTACYGCFLPYLKYTIAYKGWCYWSSTRFHCRCRLYKGKGRYILPSAFNTYIPTTNTCLRVLNQFHGCQRCPDSFKAKLEIHILFGGWAMYLYVNSYCVMLSSQDMVVISNQFFIVSKTMKSSILSDVFNIPTKFISGDNFCSFMRFVGFRVWMKACVARRWCRISR